ncbi:MAG: hypothetical protein II471_05770 [Bacteroidales bacterium]|nr:hypothetical protein [Bacteroidales bacterium]
MEKERKKLEEKGLTGEKAGRLKDEKANRLEGEKHCIAINPYPLPL